MLYLLNAIIFRIVFFHAKTATCVLRKTKQWAKINPTESVSMKNYSESIKKKIKKLNCEILKMMEECQGLKELEQVNANDHFDIIQEKLWAISERVKNM